MAAYENMGSRWTVYVVDCGGDIDNVVGGEKVYKSSKYGLVSCKNCCLPIVKDYNRMTEIGGLKRFWCTGKRVK